MSVRYETNDGISIITIDRQEAMNALNGQTLEELGAIVKRIDADASVRAVVITGAGRAFVAGADIAQMKDMDSAAAKAFSELGNSVFVSIERLRPVTIAALNGFALGGGMELALACDIRIASEKAKLGQPETTLGITPGFGGTQRLPRAIGTSNAMLLIATGDVINAQTALELGLVSKITAPEQLMEECMALAGRIAKNAPVAVALAKRSIYSYESRFMDKDIDTEATNFAQCFSTQDQKRGMEAFLNKEKNISFLGK